MNKQVWGTEADVFLSSTKMIVTDLYLFFYSNALIDVLTLRHNSYIDHSGTHEEGRGTKKLERWETNSNNENINPNVNNVIIVDAIC